jgi:hypothetical protein
MKTIVQKRLARFAGFLVLSLLLVAVSVQAAQALRVQGSGPVAVPQTTSSQLQGLTTAAQNQHHQGAAASASLLTPAAGTQGRGGVALAPSTPASGAQPASSTTSSTTAWIVGSVAAVLIVGFAAWALIRRRRQPGELASAAYCAQHPEDSLCGAA